MPSIGTYFVPGDPLIAKIKARAARLHEGRISSCIKAALRRDFQKEPEAVTPIAASASDDLDACHNCRFWEAGECHRMPPQATALLAHGAQISDTNWPTTLPHEWCGEHQREAGT